MMETDFAALAAELTRKAEEACANITKDADRSATTAKQQIREWLDRQLTQVRALADLMKHGGMADLIGKSALTALHDVELSPRDVELNVPFSSQIQLEVRTGGDRVLYRNTIGKLDSGKYRMLVLFLPRE